MDKKKWESIEYTYAGHSTEGIMSMALMKWKECKLEDREDPSLYDLSEALKAIDLDTHAICQVHNVFSLPIILVKKNDWCIGDVLEYKALLEYFNKAWT